MKTRGLYIWLGVAIVSEATLIVLAFVGWRFWGTTHKEFFDGVFGAVVGALIGSVITLILVWIGVKQLAGIAATASADFVLRSSDQFFRPDARALIHLLDSDYLQFKHKMPLCESFFEVDESRINASQLHEDLKHYLLDKKAFSVYEIDDLLLGPLEDLGYLEEVGTVDLRMVDNTFGFYIQTICGNHAIEEYLKAQGADEPDSRTWEYVNRLAEKIGELD